MSESRWQALWLVHSRQRGWLACLLWPLSLVYASLMALRRALYALGALKTHRVGVPVIVVGNVVVGGAGKTPTVIAVVNHLRAQGWQPGVVSRGHGRHSDQVSEVRPDTPPSESGDEPALIRQRTGVPVWVAASRVMAAQALLRAHPDVNILVCDDGMQHWALHRDLQIVVFDDRGTGNGWLLPAGLLREAWPGGTPDRHRADLVLHQHREEVSATPLPSAPGVLQFSATRRLAAHAVGPDGERMPLPELRAQHLTAVGGIARPAVFFDMLRAAGLQPAREIGLPDHADTTDYAAAVQDHATTLLCTEKDAVKLFPLLAQVPPELRPRAWAVSLEMTPNPAFFTALDNRLQALRPQP